MARPIPRPEPVTSATRSLSTIRTTRIEGRKPRGKQGPPHGHMLPTRWPKTVRRVRCKSAVANLLWSYSFHLGQISGVFLRAAFCVFAKLVTFILVFGSLLSPASNSNIEDKADAPNPILIRNYRHSRCFLFGGM